MLIEKVKTRVREGRVDQEPFRYADVVSVDVPNLKVDYLHDDVILVHDVPITKAGVQAYGDGRYLKSVDALRGLAPQYTPVSISHPDRFFSEKNDDEFLRDLVGYQGDHYFDEDLKKNYANLYLFADKLSETVQGKIILDRLKAKKSIDVSIGFMVEAVPEKGDYDGESYDFRDTKIDIDHTALLPSEVGRWSYPDGVGIGADHAPARDACSEKTDEVQRMSDETTAQKPTEDEKRTDEQAAPVQDAAKALEDVKKELADAQKALEDFRAKEQARLDAEAKADAAARDQLADSLTAKLWKGKDEASATEFRTFCQRLDRAGLNYLSGLLDAAVVRDNRLIVPIEPREDVGRAKNNDRLSQARAKQRELIDKAQGKKNE
jgi:hypothetical protein